MIMKTGINFFPQTDNGGDVMEEETYVPIEAREKKKMVSKLKDMQYIWIPMHRISEQDIDKIGENVDEVSEKKFISVYKNHYELWTQFGDKKPKKEPLCKTCEFEISNKEERLSDELNGNCFGCFCFETGQEYNWY